MQQKILITGGTGFIGRALVARLGREGHQLRVLTRNPARAARLLGAQAEFVSPEDGMGAAVAGCDTVINLAGENIFKGRWSKKRKQQLIDSRLELTRALVAASNAEPSVKHFISTSAVGFYGDTAAQDIDEQSPAANDFLAQLCVDWEKEAQAFEGRLAVFRVGVVMGTEDGALATMLTPFKLGLGGILGNGKQYFSWIHLDDVCEAFAAAVGDVSYQGVYNLSAPNPVTNLEFTKTLGRVIRRPTLFPVPSFALKIALGESAEALLGGQKVLPKALQQQSFSFQHPELEGALEHLLNNQTQVQIRAVSPEEKKTAAA